MNIYKIIIGGRGVRTSRSRRLKSREFNQILRPIYVYLKYLHTFWYTPTLTSSDFGIPHPAPAIRGTDIDMVGNLSQAPESHRNLHQNVSPRLEGSQQSDYLPLSPQKLLKETLPKNTCKTNFCFTANWYILSNIKRLQLFFLHELLVTSANRSQWWKFSKSNTASSWPTRGPPWHHHHRSVATAVATFVAGWVCRFVGRHAEPEKSIGIRAVEALQSQWPRIR